MKVVTLGEIMLRLSSPGFTRFVQAQSFDVTYGGGEANVAVALSNYGFDSYFVSRIPKHEIGQSAVNHLRRFGVKDDFIVRGGERLGIYFLETGASQRASKVIYDRSDAAVTSLKHTDLDWDEVFKDATWFHWTGITAALGKTMQETLVAACKAAKRAGVTISADLNYRKKLWTPAEAQAVMVPLMEYVDVCIANEEDAEKSLGFMAGSTNIEHAHLDEEAYAYLTKELKAKFGFKAVAITLRESFSASMNGWSAILCDENDCQIPYRSKRYEIQVVDRVGGGDSFASGLIYGLTHKDSSKEALEFAVAASCLKHTIPGDFNLVSVAEVDALAGGSGSGRVER
ncbi:sugar kinase [bacterium]|nr:MAG: sugar kinase [bacterium]